MRGRAAEPSRHFLAKVPGVGRQSGSLYLCPKRWAGEETSSKMTQRHMKWYPMPLKRLRQNPQLEALGWLMGGCSKHRGAARDTCRTGPGPNEMTVFSFNSLQPLEKGMNSTEKLSF